MYDYKHVYDNARNFSTLMRANVNEFIPDHIELVSGAAATQEALVKIERVGR